MKKRCLWMVLTALMLAPAGALPVRAEESVEDVPSLDAALEELAAADWGTMPASLQVIDQAIAASHGDAAARKDLEAKLGALLGGEASHAVKQYACRKLSLIGTADTVPLAAPLLLDEKLSHMARIVMERIPDAAAAKALRDALSKASGLPKVGIINSLAAKKDAAAVADLIELLGSDDLAVAGAAARALGKIGSTAALPALAELRKKAPEAMGVVIADAYLDIAEKMRAERNWREAAALLEELMSDENRLIRLTVLRSSLGRLRQRADDERKMRRLGRIAERVKDLEAKKMLLGVLGEMSSAEAMRLAAAMLGDAEAAAPAVAALLKMARKMRESSPAAAAAELARVLERLESEDLRREVEAQLEEWK